MRGSRSIQKFQACINLYDSDYLVKATILPEKPFPHVSYDSPRKWDMGRDARVLSFVVLDDDGNDRTRELWYHRGDIRAAVLREWAIDQTAERMLEVLA